MVVPDEAERIENSLEEVVGEGKAGRRKKIVVAQLGNWREG